MKKIVSVLLCVILICSACNDSNEPKPTAKDSVHKNAADSIRYNPATPAAQNSDDPDRFSR